MIGYMNFWIITYVALVSVGDNLLSEAQLRFVTNTQSGMGLMKCGNVVIPFDNTIEKGTDLYNLYNTNIHEKIAMEKSKNAVDNE